MTDTDPTIDDFEIAHYDDEQYDYDAGAGGRVQVRFDGHSNGSRVGATHYAADGERLDYYRLRVNSADARRLTFEGDDEDGLPLPVLRALHAGGWEVQNLPGTSMLTRHDGDSESDAGDESPAERDPDFIAFLDLRDIAAGWASEADSEYLTGYLAALSRGFEEAAVIAWERRVPTTGGDLDT